MLNMPSFSEDMLPRHFPKKETLEKKSIVPTPTLPGLSLILDDENKNSKLESKPKIEPRKTFQQWKQQHEGIFVDNSTAQQRRHEKKQVRFEADSQTNGNFNENPHQRFPPPLSPNMELSYYENPASQAENYCQNQPPKQYHQHNLHQNSKSSPHGEGFEKSMFHSRCNSKSPATSPIVNDKAYYAANEHQMTMDIHQNNRIGRCEPMKEYFQSMTVLPSVHKEERQFHRNSSQPACQGNQNHWKLNQPTPTNRQICCHGMQPNTCINEQELSTGQHIMKPFNAPAERNPKNQLTNEDTLFSIMEEQQQHILMQQNQILNQQKQNMMQQKQIFMLQHQVQQLLLRNGNSSHESPTKSRSTICGNNLPSSSPSAFTNGINTENISNDLVCNGTKTRSSIGVMTSFMGNMNDAIPNGLHKFNERFKSTTKLANEKFIENIGGISSEEYSYKDSMLDKINDAIRNSSAMIDYRTNGTTNGYVSPSQQPDINIAAQALIYESSSTNNGCMNEPKTTDRSFALYMLGMKYDCAQDDGPKNADKRDFDLKQQSPGQINDQVSVNISPEVYDYLKRHGLLKPESA